MPKIILEGHIDVPYKDLDEVNLELPIHIELTRKEAGCLVFKVERDHVNECRFNVYEEFISQEAFEKHQERVRASRWGSITKSVKRNYIIKTV